MASADVAPQGIRRDVQIIEEDVASALGRLGNGPRLMAGTSVLITGAGGLIGGYLADVAAAINASSATSPPMRIYLATRTAPTPTARLGHLLQRPDIEFLVPADGKQPWLPSHVDYVMHAASPASPTQFMRDPVGALDANSEYLRALLDLAHRSQARGFLYVSSSEVYGDPPDSAIPTAETYVGAVDPLSPRASYAEGKRFGEALCMAFLRQYNVPVSIVRPFHIHGPGLRLDDGRIVAELIRVGLTREPFRLASDGSATRCYGYVTDVAVGMYKAMWLGAGETFNLGADHPETSILALSSMVADLMGCPPPVADPNIGPVHLRDAPRRSRPDLTRARVLLGYETRISLEDGLRRTIDWHLARRGLER